MKLAVDCRVRTFAVLTLLLFASRTADAATTYLVTPDLSRETNPMVRVLGFGWSQLLAAEVILSLLVVGLSYWALFSPPLRHPQEQGLRFREFADVFYFGRRAALTDYLWRPPVGWRLNLKMAGHTLPRVLIAMGFSVAASSLASVYCAPWREFLRLTAPSCYYVPLVLLSVWSIHSFLRHEYSGYSSAAPARSG